jgi:polyphosphate kinase 2 (PPK2 family)
LESHLYRNGTRILKFFLHLSKEEQKRRFLERLDDGTKNWKLNPADIKERGYWKQYRKAYEQCLAATSTKKAPWFVVPADSKEDARLIISGLIIRALEEIKMGYPVMDAAQRKSLQAMRQRL